MNLWHFIAALFPADEYMPGLGFISPLPGSLAPKTDIHSPTTAPHSGFDRAGGPYNGHPAARRGYTEGAAASAGHSLGKGGNGALHGRGISARCNAASSGNAAAFFPSAGEA